MKTNINTLKGEDLFVYCSEHHPDIEFREAVEMLPYAVMSSEKAYAILERVVSKNQTIKFHYPACDNPQDIENKEIIGDVPDGCLYIS